MVEVKLHGNLSFEEDCEYFESKLGRKPNDDEKFMRMHDYECWNMNRIRDACFPEYTVEAHGFIWKLDENLEKYEKGDLESFSRMVCRVATKLTGVELTPVF